jgi:hypothetical protein
MEPVLSGPEKCDSDGLKQRLEISTALSDSGEEIAAEMNTPNPPARERTFPYQSFNQ